jgi:hypothetical protein
VILRRRRLTEANGRLRAAVFVFCDRWSGSFGIAPLRVWDTVCILRHFTRGVSQPHDIENWRYISYVDSMA